MQRTVSDGSIVTKTLFSSRASARQDVDLEDTHGAPERIRRGSWAELVRYLLDKGAQDLVYCKAFLLTHVMFSSSRKLLATLLRHLSNPPTALVRPSSEMPEPMRHKLYRERKTWLVKILRLWMWAYPDDFEREQIKGVHARLLTLPPEYWAQNLHPHTFSSLQGLFKGVTTSMDAAAQRHEHLVTHQHRMSRSTSLPVKSFLFKFTDDSPVIALRGMPSDVLARQMTIMARKLFQEIPAREFTRASWCLDPGMEWDHAPGILSFVTHHNKIVRYTQTEVTSCQVLSQRVNVLTRFIGIVDALLTMGNFDSAFAVAGGLRSAEVIAHKSAWIQIDESTLERWRFVQELTDMTGDQLYRDYLGRFVRAGQFHVPFFGVVLGDLVRAGRGCGYGMGSDDPSQDSWLFSSERSAGRPGIVRASADDGFPSFSSLTLLTSRDGAGSDPRILFSKYVAVYAIVQDIVDTQRLPHISVDELKDGTAEAALREVVIQIKPHDAKRLFYEYEDSMLLSDARVEIGTWRQLVHYMVFNSRNDPRFRQAFFITYPDFGASMLLLEDLLRELLRPPPPMADIRRNILETLTRLQKEGVRDDHPVMVNLKRYGSFDAMERDTRFENHKIYIVKLIQAWLWDLPNDFSDAHRALITRTTKHILNSSSFRRELSVNAWLSIERSLGDLVTSTHTASQQGQLRRTESRRFSMQSSLPSSAFLKRFTDPQVVVNNDGFDSETPLAIAQQLTQILWEPFALLRPRQLTQLRWMGNDKWLRARNVLSMIIHHNKTSFWVAQLILAQTQDGPRARVLKKFIKVAYECLQLGNFDSAFAIVGGLNLPSVHRLRTSWDTMGSNTSMKWTALKTVTSSAYNNMRYRRTFAQRTEQQQPRIPFLGIVLGDLAKAHAMHQLRPRKVGHMPSSATKYGADESFVHSESVPAYDKVREKPSQTEMLTRDRMVNFTRYLNTYNIIREVLDAQKSPFKIEPDPAMQTWIREGILQVQVDGQQRELLQLSINVEPKDHDELEMRMIDRSLESVGFDI